MEFNVFRGQEFETLLTRLLVLPRQIPVWNFVRATVHFFNLCACLFSFLCFYRFNCLLFISAFSYVVWKLVSMYTHIVFLWVRLTCCSQLCKNVFKEYNASISRTVLNLNKVRFNKTQRLTTKFLINSYTVLMS